MTATLCECFNCRPGGARRRPAEDSIFSEVLRMLELLELDRSELVEDRRMSDGGADVFLVWRTDELDA